MLELLNRLRASDIRAVTQLLGEEICSPEYASSSSLHSSLAGQLPPAQWSLTQCRATEVTVVETEVEAVEATPSPCSHSPVPSLPLTLLYLESEMSPSTFSSTLVPQLVVVFRDILKKLGDGA